ncbi:MAG: dynamin family protein [Campylobacterales bacterium]|nr:dynamin family protein [Campylobacterales bacterium]
MNQLTSMEDFYKSLKDISIINSGLDEKREQLKNYINEFNGVIQAKSVDENIAKQNPEMAKMLEETLVHIKNSTNVWIENFEEALKKEKFRSDLENYFIIIIFGKVKAGKSSLGNFVAKRKLDTQTVQFFKYDEAGQKQSIKKLEEIEDTQFATNNLECTIEIQGFTLDGMAWIDTPGLGSMVKENGELAKAYIQSADYIIYPTSSDSPLQQDETKQLKELFEQNKKVTICITKSDEKEEDEVDGEMVQILQNKSSNRRDSQEKYVNDEIIKILQSNKESVLGDIFSISTHTASKGLEDNNDILFEQSNIPKFYELITKVIKEKSTKLKSDTPYDGFRSFIDNGILGIGSSDNESSISTIKDKLYDLDKKIKESFERFEILKENANNDLESEIESVVAEYSNKITQANSNEIFVTIDVELYKKVVEIIQKNINEIFADFDMALESLTTSFSTSDFLIEDKYKTIKTSTENKNKTFFSGLLNVVNVCIALIPHPAAKVVSTIIMSTGADTYLGEKIGEMTSSEATESIKIGDNKGEVIQRFKADRLKHYELVAKDIYKGMQNSFFSPLQGISQDVSSKLSTFEQNIKKIRG